MNEPALTEVFRRLLWVRASPKRLERLARALADVDVASAARWVDRLEMHGILGLADRNLALAGCAWPEPVRDRVSARLEAVRADARRSQLTLARFLAETKGRVRQVVLLKGASLALDVYPEAHLRSQGDLDVLVRERDVKAAVAAAERAGLGFAEEQFPLWWYRLAHFHAKLHPATALMREIEIHWRLQHPALLITAKTAEILARAVPVSSGGAEVWTLDRVDRWLHLATHLTSHARSASSVPSLRELVADPEPDLRLKWIVDLVAETEGLASSADPGVVAERAREWNADDSVEALFALLEREDLLDDEVCVEWVRACREKLGASSARRDPLPREASPRKGWRAHSVFDFRLSSLALAPRWIWPPLRYVRRRYRIRGASWFAALVAFAWRFVHAAGVVAHFAMAIDFIPLARLERTRLRARRRAARLSASEPERILDLVSAWRGREPVS